MALSGECKTLKENQIVNKPPATAITVTEAISLN